MRVFVAGGSGAIGPPLIERLVRAGHSVVAMTRSAHKADAISDTGAEPAVADALDEAAVTAAVRDAAPEVVIHELTALSGLSGNPRRFDREFETTNRLRTEGTDYLLRAAREAGARRFIAQSFGGWPYAREGGPVKTEEDPFDPDAPATARKSIAAIRYLEDAVTGADGIDGRGPALRRLLRAGHRARPGRGQRVRGHDPQTQVPDPRRGHWCVVVRPHRRRGGGDSRSG
jgi:nucleoside-diphosphate-sugar epimerase